MRSDPHATDDYPTTNNGEITREKEVLSSVVTMPKLFLV